MSKSGDVEEFIQVSAICYKCVYVYYIHIYVHKLLHYITTYYMLGNILYINTHNFSIYILILIIKYKISIVIRLSS